MENNKDKKHISIKTKITLSIVSFILIILTIAFVFSYLNTRSISRDGIKNRLLNMVSIASLEINGDEHKLLKTTSDQDTEPYKNIVKKLKNIQGSSGDIYYIYTMRENNKGEITFIVDPDDSDPNNISPIGEVYNDSSEFLKNNFNNIGKPIVENDFYSDQWGTWLSGYAPIYDNNGIKDGVLGIDIDAKNVLKIENHILWVYIIAFFISVFLSTIFGFVLSRRLASSIVEITNILKNTSKEDSLEIKNNNSDEIDELAKVIKDTMNEVDVTKKNQDDRILEKNKTLERLNKLMVGRELEMIKLKKEIIDLKNNEK